MSNRTRMLSAALSCLALGATAAEAADGYECRQGDLVRQVEVQYLTPGEVVPCQVEYRKPTEGADNQILWSAGSEQGYCEFKAREFHKKLQSWGWSCTDAAQPAEPAEAAEESETGEQLGDG